MGNRQSRLHPEDLSSPQPDGGSNTANSFIRGDGSGNSNSNNTISTLSGNITINSHHGGTDSSRNDDEILQCLYTSPYQEHRLRVRQPVEGTCSWVTEHPKYMDWLRKKTSALLWLSADPGCGKSVIASFLVEHLGHRPDAIVCYFFFKDDSDEQRSATLALCAILHQIFKKRGSLIKFARPEFKARGSGFAQEVDTLWDILVEVVKNLNLGRDEVICVVDALDECDEGTLVPLIRYITRLSESQTFNLPLKFLVTSRPYHRIERKLGSPATTIRLKGEDEVDAITADVSRVIDEGIKNLELYWEQPGELGYLRDLLESSADRTFLWVSLVLDILKDSEDDSREEFTSIVSTAPPDLPGLYTKILDRSTRPDKAKRILNIVVAAARPLTLREMNVAFRIERRHRSTKDLRDLPRGFEKTVKNLCGLFVRVIDSKIYLVHQTAREFLLDGSSPGLGNWQHTLCFEDSNFVLADICISYLSLSDFENYLLSTDKDGNVETMAVVDHLQKYEFLGYAAIHWADHFRDSQDRQMELFEFTRLICKAGSGRMLTWFQVYWFGSQQLYRCPTDFTHLMIASWLGQRLVVKQLLEEGGDVDARCKRYGTSLNIAAVRKDKAITNMLVRKNAKAYIGGKEYKISSVRGHFDLGWLVHG